nr:uncharacterized calcium-binding protein At1g02270 [Tanacetum cinerariifolium]
GKVSDPFNFFLIKIELDGSKRGQVYKFLRSQGFVSSHDTAHHYTDTDAHKVNVFLGEGFGFCIFGSEFSVVFH